MTAAQKAPRRVGWIEWAMAAVGATLAVGILATLMREALVYDDGPPVIVATLVDVHPTEAGYVARFMAENRGPTTAAEITIVGRLKDGDRTLEEASVTLDYVARKSFRNGGLVFASDPKTATLELRATSYRKP